MMPSTAPTPIPAPSPKPRSHTGRLVSSALSISILLATLFTAFSPRLFSGDFGDSILAILTPQVVGEAGSPGVRQEIRIGIVSGHWGHDEDPGAVCGNGVKESDVNYNIALLVRQELERLGYTVDLLQELDPRLVGYRAAALISIHNDTCADLGLEATGYKVAAASGTRDANLSARLVACLVNRYGNATGMEYHAGSITDDMTQYHAFGELNENTTAVIIETGFLYLDYPILSEHTDWVAQGIVNGLVCFINNESLEATPVP